MIYRKDEDPLASLFEKHQPPVPSAPKDEWLRIAQRLPTKTSKRTWYILTFALSFATTLLLCVPHRAAEDREWDELWMEEGISSTQNPRSYEDWLRLTDALEQHTR